MRPRVAATIFGLLGTLQVMEVVANSEPTGKICVACVHVEEKDINSASFSRTSVRLI